MLGLEKKSRIFILFAFVCPAAAKLRSGISSLLCRNFRRRKKIRLRWAEDAEERERERERLCPSMKEGAWVVLDCERECVRSVRERERERERDRSQRFRAQ